MEIPLEMGPTG